MSKISSETIPKIFLEPREKRIDDSKPLNLVQHTVVNDIAEGRTSRLAKPVTKKVIKYDLIKHIDKPRCMARVATSNQCYRTTKEESDYCGCHAKHLPYGRFDGPVEGKKLLCEPKKRGPRFKNIKEYTLDELDTDLYVQTQLVLIDDEYYLLDKYGLLYTNDSKSLEIVGRREDDSIAWFV